MWIDDPSNARTEDFVPLLRPKPGKAVVVFLLGQPLRLFLHYWRKKSWPCVGRNCPLCAKKVSRRLYSYYPTSTLQGNPAVLELTPVSEAALLRQLEEYSHEPTGVVKVSRPTGRKNLPCEVKWREIKPEDPLVIRPGDPSFLIKTLCRMWKLDCPDGDPTSTAWVADLRDNLICSLAEMESNA